MGGDSDKERDSVNVAARGPGVAEAAGVGGTGARMQLATEDRGRVEENGKGAWSHMSCIFQ